MDTASAPATFSQAPGERRSPRAVVGFSPGTLAVEGLAPFLRAAQEARRGGLAALVLREPGLDDAPLLAFARALRAVFARNAAFFAVHDRIHVALAAGADGAHLGWRSLDITTARAAADTAPGGDTLALSRSTHAGDGLESCASADWVVHGPVHAVPGKALEPIGFDGLARFVSSAPCPVFALGGLGAADASRARAAGARGIAVRRALWDAPDGPAQAAEALLRAWGTT